MEGGQIGWKGERGTGRGGRRTGRRTGRGTGRVGCDVIQVKASLPAASYLLPTCLTGPAGYCS